MQLDLSEEAVEFGAVIRSALADLGGVALVEDFNSDPAAVAPRLSAALGEVGVWELDTAQPLQLEAASQVCRSAGYWAVPYPVAERLARPADLDVDGLSVMGSAGPVAPIRGVDARWGVVDLAGSRSLAVPAATSRVPYGLAPLMDLTLTGVDSQGRADLPTALALPCWTLLGMIDRAIELTRQYVMAREQFGQTLSTFQSVRFDLTDAAVARNGADELGRYSLWSIAAGRDDALADALAFRLCVADAADAVFPIAHQLHGAIGFCDETPLSWVSRMSQLIRRLPFSAAETARVLEQVVGTEGISGLFDDASVR